MKTSLLGGIAIALALSLSGWSQAAQGQAAQGQAAQPQKQYKDAAEYEAYNAVVKETDPKKKLALLNAWKEKYPQTDFKKDRQLYYLDTYKNLNQPEQMVAIAKEILVDDPKDFTAMYWISTIVPTLPNAATNAEYPDLADKGAKGLLQNLDTQFAPEKRPATTPEDQWKKARTDVEAGAYKTAGWSAMVKKDTAAAKENFTKTLQINPAAGEVSYWLGLTIVGEKNPETYPVGLYHIARAAAYDGPGALAPAGRQQVNDYLTKAYTGFHGEDPKGLEQLKLQAKTNPLPPANFTIPSVKDIALKKLKEEEEAAAKDPVGALWKGLYTELSGPNGTQYFETGLKGAQAPRLRGTLVSQTAKTVVLALSDKTTPQVTLELEAPLPKAEPGTVVEFEGVGKEFTQEPFMLTMEIDKSKIYGWPAAAPAKKPAGSKKVSPSKRRR